ncbi:hypothetical protein EDD22DRAFT_170853 [Suillus occidentalis]|nr:hypothetical protein EDD22DRAFT_170853 [Suillus occidentalis]
MNGLLLRHCFELQRDRDVVAQLEVSHSSTIHFPGLNFHRLNALAKQPTVVFLSTFTKTVLVSNYYDYRIRCQATMVLVHCAIRKLDFWDYFIS